MRFTPIYIYYQIYLYLMDETTKNSKQKIANFILLETKWCLIKY